VKNAEGELTAAQAKVISLGADSLVAAAWGAWYVLVFLLATL
jgi:hypothetical protein